jgi:hypothetical protein
MVTNTVTLQTHHNHKRKTMLQRDRNLIIIEVVFGFLALGWISMPAATPQGPDESNWPKSPPGPCGMCEPTASERVEAPAQTTVETPARTTASAREHIISYAEQMASAMKVIKESSGELGSACSGHDLATCGGAFDRFVGKVEDARRLIAVARSNEPSCLAEVGTVTNAFVDRYYNDVLSIQASFHAGDIPGTRANLEKAMADVSDTAGVTAAGERGLTACHLKNSRDGEAQVQTTVKAPVQTTMEAPAVRVQTVREKVQAAVTAEYACTPEYIKPSVSDETGAIYFAGCGLWIYTVTVYPDGRTKVLRITRWNGVN